MIQQVAHYQIKELLGRGGMGVVYRADDPKLFGEVAVKILRFAEPDPFLSQEEQRKEAVKQQQALQRFEREAKVVARLQHFAIVPVYDFGCVQVGKMEYPFMVMRLMKGGSLKALLQKGALPLEELVRILEWLASALDKVHQQKIVHRDLKPANILFDEDGLPYLADFGIAKLLETQAVLSESEVKTLTQTRMTLGTPAYMSPEQTYAKAHRKGSLDGRSDIYAIGAILYEMLTGKRPYHQAQDAREVKYAHRMKPAPRLDELRTDLGAQWQAVIDKAMAKQPDDRYATASELAAALKALISPPPPPPPLTPPDYLKAGNQYYQQGNYDSAIAEYSRALLLDSNYSYGYLYRAVAFHAKGQFDKAIPDYNQAIRLNASDPKGYHYRGLAYANMGQLVDAIRDYDDALRLKPDYTDATNNRQAAYQALLKRAQSAYQEGQLDQALADYDAALRFNPNDKALQKLRQQASYAKHPALGIGSERICAKDGMVQVYVPAGKFKMGSAKDDPDAWDSEKPQHSIYLDAYWMDKTPVTNAMFAKFVQETGYQTEAEKEGFAWGWTGSTWDKINGAQWRHPRGSKKLFGLMGGSDLTGKDNHPVVSVSWNDAVAYAKWAERRLPTEAEWEKAAGGTDGRKWPWGNELPTPQLANTYESGIKDTTPVGNYPAGASPYGALDMSGNVWEWCNDSYDSNYYASSPKENPQGPESNNAESTSGTKVLRGGSWWFSARDSRARSRDGYVANYRGVSRGFRCASSPL